MAPRAGGRRKEPASEDFREFGVVGRKTGIGLPDTGERDEHGMAPIDGLFSSPEKQTPNGDDTGEMDMDIESDAGPGPVSVMKGAPRLLPRGTSPRRTNFQSPAMRNPHIGRSSSPVRGSIVDSDPPSEPTSAVARKLDYGGGGASHTNGARPNNSRLNKSTRAPSSPSGDEEEEDTILRGQQPSPLAHEGADDSMQMIDTAPDDSGPGDDDETEQPEPEPEVDADPEPEPEPEPTKSSPEAPASQTKKRGRPAKANASKANPVKANQAKANSSKTKTKEAPVGSNGAAAEGGTSESEDRLVTAPKRGRRPKAQVEAAKETEKQDTSKTSASASARERTKRRRVSAEAANQSEQAEQEEVQEQEQEQEPQEDDRSAKRQRTEKQPAKAGRPGRPKSSTTSAPKAESAKASSVKAKEKESTATKGRKPGRPRQSDVGEDSILGKVQKGPPLPKARGLVSLKQQDNSILRTRSGRQSYRPLAYWRNEHVVHDDEDVWEDPTAAKNRKHAKFVLPSVKEVVRIEEEEAPAKKRAGRPKSKAPQRRQKEREDPDEAEDPEPWETEGGRIEGEAVIWDPDYEFNPPAPEEPVAFEQSEIAIASGAIQTREIRDATFRFAKLLSLPFFGAGVVDLPPGTEKKPKNSRKNQMTFFVHYGKVLVTVNETQFRISAGGFWNVPRGNYYNIQNDYDQPARLFFAQGSEVMIQEPDARADRTAGDLTMSQV